MENIDTELSNVIDDFKDLSRQEIEEKNHDALKMINYYTNLTNAIESRRIGIYHFTLQYLVLLCTAIGVFLHLNPSTFYKILFFSFAFLQIIFSLRIVYEYILQSQCKYTFNEESNSENGNLANNWKWFYRGNSMTLNIFNAEEPNKAYVDGLKDFFLKYKKESHLDRLINNIQQLYLLQVHNGYKNRFYLKLSRYMLQGFTITFVVILILGFLLFIA